MLSYMLGLGLGPGLVCAQPNTYAYVSCTHARMRAYACICIHATVQARSSPARRRSSLSPVDAASVAKGDLVTTAATAISSVSSTTAENRAATLATRLSGGKVSQVDTYYLPLTTHLTTHHLLYATLHSPLTAATCNLQLTTGWSLTGGHAAGGAVRCWSSDKGR